MAMTIHKAETRPRAPHYDSLRWLAAAFSFALFSISLVLGYFEVIPPVLAIATFSLSGPLGLVVAFSTGFTYIKNPSRRSFILILIAAAAPLTIAGRAAWIARMPPLFDVSTDLASPPEYRRSPVPFDDSKSPEIKYFYPDLVTHMVPGPLSSRIKDLQIWLQSFEGWEVQHVDSENWMVEAVAKRGFFKERYDVVVRLRSSGTWVAVDVRSRSRLGLADGGQNAALITEVLQRLERAFPDV